MNRTSTNLVKFFGAEVFASTISSSIGNVVVDGNGNEKSTSPANVRLSSDRVEEATINSSHYQIAVAHLERRGVAPLAAKAMALVFLDVAKIQNMTVMQLLDNTNDVDIKMVTAEAYKYINQLRNNTSSLARSQPTNNSQSFRARYLIP